MDFKSLTSSPDQRDSFASHILRATVQAMMSVDVARGGATLKEQDKDKDKDKEKDKGIHHIRSKQYSNTMDPKLIAEGVRRLKEQK